MWSNRHDFECLSRSYTYCKPFKCDFVQLRPNSITLSWSQTGPKLVADLQRVGIWPIIELASSELEGLRPALELSATSFEPVCDQIA